MKRFAIKRVPLTSVCLLFGFGFPDAALRGQDPADGGIGRPVAGDSTRDKLLVYELNGILDADQAERVHRDIADWRRREPEIRTILIDIDSPGTKQGKLEPARELAEFLSDLKEVRVVARVGPDKVAGNATALVVLAADDAFMAPGAKLGIVSNDRAGQPVEVPDGDEKAAAEARRLFQSFASRRGEPIGRSHLAAAMVSRFHPAIFKVTFERTRGNLVELETRYLTLDEIDKLSPADKALKKPGEIMVLAADKKLELDQDRSRDLKFTESLGSADIHTLLGKLRLPIGDQNILYHDRGGAVTPLSPATQTLVDFLNHPITRFFLVMVGSLCILIEIQLLGSMIPLIAGLTAFGVFFIAGLFPATGVGVPTTDLWEIALFALGIGLLSVEFLLLPGILFFGLSGAGACLISLCLAMIPPASASASNALTFSGALTILIFSGGTSTGIFFVLLRYLPSSRFLSRSGIVMRSSIQGTPTGDSPLLDQARIAALRGKVGVAVTPLRPAGTIEVNGARIDVVADGDFVEMGMKVQIMDADGTRTVVRRV